MPKYALIEPQKELYFILSKLSSHSYLSGCTLTSNLPVDPTAIEKDFPCFVSAIRTLYKSSRDRVDTSGRFEEQTIAEATDIAVALF